MPLRPMLPALLLAFALSILVGVLAAARGASVPLALAAGLFAVQVLVRARAHQRAALANEPMRVRRCSTGRGAIRCLPRSSMPGAPPRCSPSTRCPGSPGAIGGSTAPAWRCSRAWRLLCATYLARDRGPLERATVAQRPHGRDGRAGHRRRRPALVYLVGSGQAANGEGGLGRQSRLHHRRRHDRADFARLAAGAIGASTRRTPVERH